MFDLLLDAVDPRLDRLLNEGLRHRLADEPQRPENHTDNADPLGAFLEDRDHGTTRNSSVARRRVIARSGLTWIAVNDWMLYLPGSRNSGSSCVMVKSCGPALVK